MSSNLILLMPQPLYEAENGIDLAQFGGLC